MPRPIDHAKREQLVAHATEVLARTGIIDTSLRSLAAEMGTSARMLVYYFGSKEQLILAVMKGSQAQNVPEPVLYSTREELRQWCLDDWQHITRGGGRSRLRILEQVFGAACGQNSPYARYTAETLAQLTHNAQRRMEAIGMPAAVAETRARLALAPFKVSSSTSSRLPITPALTTLIAGWWTISFWRRSRPNRHDYRDAHRRPARPHLNTHEGGSRDQLAGGVSSLCWPNARIGHAHLTIHGRCWLARRPPLIGGLT